MPSTKMQSGRKRGGGGGGEATYGIRYGTRVVKAQQAREEAKFRSLQRSEAVLKSWAGKGAELCHEWDVLDKGRIWRGRPAFSFLRSNATSALDWMFFG